MSCNRCSSIDPALEVASSEEAMLSAVVSYLLRKLIEGEPDAGQLLFATAEHLAAAEFDRVAAKSDLSAPF